MFLEFICIAEQFLFSILPSILTFNFDQILGLVFGFWGPNGLFLGLGVFEICFGGLLIMTDNFAFLCTGRFKLESTIPDGRRPVGRSAGPPVGLDYLELKPTQPKLKLGLGLSLAIMNSV